LGWRQVFGFDCSGVELLQAASTKIAEGNGMIEHFEPTPLKSLGAIVRIGASSRSFCGAVMNTA